MKILELIGGLPKISGRPLQLKILQMAVFFDARLSTLDLDLGQGLNSFRLFHLVSRWCCWIQRRYFYNLYLYKLWVHCVHKYICVYIYTYTYFCMLRCPSRNSTGAGHCWRLRRTSHRGFHQILSWHCCMLSVNWHETTIERTWLFHFFLNWKQDGVILWDCNFGLLQKGDFVVTCRQFPFEAFLLQVQDILSRRHGMQQEHIERIPAQRHGATVWELVNWSWWRGALHGCAMAVPWHCHVRMIPNDSNVLLVLCCFALHGTHRISRWNPETDHNGQTTCMAKSSN